MLIDTFRKGEKIIKKFISLLLSFIICLALCGCNLNTGKLKSYFEDYIGSIENYVENLADILPSEEVIVEEYYVFPPEYNAAYNALSNKQKELYKKIYAITDQMPEGYVIISKNYDNVIKDISVAYTAVLYDHPEVFWMPSTYIVGEKNSSSGKEVLLAFNYQTSNGEVKYAVSKTEREKMQKELDAKVNSIIFNIPESDSEFEKEKKINDYICANTEYDKTGNWVDTVYGCLIENKALCEGYSKAFKLLCNKVGIECDLIVGYSEDEGHMWNSVNIENKHSFVDVTWNDNKDLPYLYFNITTEQLLYDHTFLPFFTEIDNDSVLKGGAFNFVERICEFKGNSYYEKYGLVLNEFEAYNYASVAAEIISKAGTDGSDSVDILISSEKLKNAFEKDPEKFLLKIQMQLNNIKITAYSLERDVLIIFFE